MSSCDESNIIKNYIVQSPSDFDILSACTGFYTNNIYNCTGDTLTLHSPTVSANAINATTLSACSGIWTSSLSGCSPITVHDELILLSGLTFSAITEDNSLTQILVRDSVSGLVKYINFSDIDQDNTLTNILAKDPITGEIKYRSVESIISAATSGDTFVTGFTYDNSNNLTVTRNDNVSITTNISQFTGLTVNGGLSATTISATTFYGDGSNLTGIPHTTDTFVTGGTYNPSTVNLDFSGNTGFVPFTVDVSLLKDDTNTFVTGFTYDNSNTFTITDNSGATFNATINTVTGLTVNGGLSATTISACTGIYTSNLYGCSPITVNDRLILLSGLTFSSITEDNSLTQILSRDSSDGSVKYRDVNTIIGAASADTFVTGFTYDNINTFTITDNSGTTFNSSINVLSATTISATTYFGDGSNLTGIPHTTDTFVSGGTYSDITDIITFTNTTGGTFNVTGITDTFVTGVTLNPGNYELTTSRNDTFNILTDLSILASDVKVTGGTYDINTGIVTFTNNSGGTFNVTGFTSGMTDSYTTDAYISGTEIKFDNNIQGVNFYRVDLLPLLSGKTNVTLFNSYTSTTDSTLATKVDGGLNVGAGSGSIFRDKTGTTLNFRTLSGGTNTTVTTVGDLNVIDVTIPTDQNTFITGFTYDDINTFTITRNDGTAFTQTINVLSATTISATTFYGDGSNLTGIPHTTDTFVSGGTYSDSTDIITFTNTTGGTFNVTGITDKFVTGGTYNAVTVNLDFSGNSGFSPFTVDVSDLKDDTNTFVTGFTYDDINTFTISDNSGSTFDASINVLSATTISATTYFGDGSNLTGISTGNTTITAYTYDNANTFTISDSSGSTFDASINIMTGLTINGDLNVNGTISGETLNLTSTPSNDNSQTQVLVRNNSSGVVEYRDASTFSGSSGSNTFVTGFTYNDNNTFTIFDNDGGSFPATFNQVSGLTVNGTLSATTLDGNTILSGGTNLLTIIDDRDDFVTGTTFGGNQAILTRNDGTEVFKLSGSSSVQLTNPSSNKIDIDVTIPPGSNTFVTGFTYDNANTFTISDNDGGSFPATINQVSGLTVNGILSATTISGGTLYGDGSNLTGIPHTTDTFVTGGTYNPSTINLDFSGNPGFSPFTVDVSALKDDTNTFVTGFTYDNSNTFTINDNSGTTFNTTINTVTGLTVNGTLSATTLDGNTILSGGTNLLTIIDDRDNYVTGTTFGSNQSVTTTRDGVDVLKLSGGTNVTLSNPSGNQIKFDVTIPSGSNTFVTGFTYDNANTFTISDNVGSTFNATINTVTGLTVNGILSATTYFGDGANLTGIATAPTLISLTADYTGVTTDYTFNCTTNTFTVTLPTAIGVKGKIYVIKNSGTGRITVDTTSSQTIDGSTSILIKTQYLSRTVQSNGSDWIVI
jgi:hypothetical protein